MILLIPINDFDEKYIFFSDIIKNIVINNSVFIRIYYSTQHFTMNGLFLSLNLVISNIEKVYNKTKCFFKTIDNADNINKIKAIENNILKKLDIKNKTPVFSIANQLSGEHIKLYNFLGKDKNIPYNFICKISGVWDDGINYGLTYKFIS